MPAAADDETAAILEGAAELLALAMSESHGPIEVLGGAFARMAGAIARGSSAIEHLRAAERERPGAASRPLAELEACRIVLEREVAVCIESLQFHDRLMQRLARVGDCLASLTDASGRRAERRRVNLGEGSIELF